MLVECMIYISILMVVMTLAYSLFYRAFEKNRDLQRNVNDILKVLQAGERWRSELRRASGPLSTQTNQGYDYIFIPQTNGIITYAFARGFVWRAAPENTNYNRILYGVKTSKIILEARHYVTACHWELELEKPQNAARLPPLFTFTAVLPNHLHETASENK